MRGIVLETTGGAAIVGFLPYIGIVREYGDPVPAKEIEEGAPGNAKHLCGVS